MPQPALLPTDVPAARNARTVELKPARLSRNTQDTTFADALDSAVRQSPPSSRADNNSTAKPESAEQSCQAECTNTSTPRGTQAADQKKPLATDDDSTPPSAPADTTAAAPQTQPPDATQAVPAVQPQSQTTVDDAQVSPVDAQSLRLIPAGDDAPVVTQPAAQPQKIDLLATIDTAKAPPQPEPSSTRSAAPQRPAAAATETAPADQQPTAVATIAVQPPPQPQSDAIKTASSPPIESNEQPKPSPKPSPVLISPSADDAEVANDAGQAQRQPAAARGETPERPSDWRAAVQLKDVVNSAGEGPPQSQNESGESDAGADRDRSAAGRRWNSAAIARTDASDHASPAVARAAQVDAAVQLENATGSAPTASASISTHPQAGAPAANLTGDPRSHGALGGAASNQNQPTGAGLGSADLEDPQFSAGIVRGLSALLNQRGGVLTMRLEPPELGSLRVQMTIFRGQVSAQFDAGTVQAQNLLERNMGVLRGALEAQGLSVDRLAVHAAPPAGTSTARDGAEDQRGTQQHDADAGGRESRGRRDGQEQHPGGRSPWRETFSRRFDPFGLATASSE